MARMIQEHIKKPLADEVLFGKLKGGGHVRVVAGQGRGEGAKEKIGFEFVEGPVTPKPEKLPGTRKRKPPKPKSERRRWLEGPGLARPAGKGLRSKAYFKRSRRVARPPAFLRMIFAEEIRAGRHRRSYA